MESLHVILWAMGGGFTLMFGLLLVIWNSVSRRMDKFDEKLTDIDRRLCRLEGAFSAKDCCVLNEGHRHRHAEGQ